MRREAAGKPPQGAAVITFCARRAAPKPRRGGLNFLFPPAGVIPRSGSHSRQPTTTVVVCCGGVCCGRVGSGRVPKAALQVQLRAAKGAALQQALRLCRRRSRRAGISASKSTRRTEPLQRRAAKGAALPKAGRSDAEGGASETPKQTKM